MASSDTTQFVARSALRFFSGTLISRFTGMLRDMIMAFCFGTSAPLAAFFLAYRFVYLIRRLFGEGLLQQGFIPYYETEKAQDPKKGALFFRDLFWTSALLLLFLVILLEVGLSILIKYQVFSSGGEEVARLSLLIVPGIFFICLFGLSLSFLQAEKSFFLPSVSPVFFNLALIVGALALSKLPIEQAVIGLSLVLSLGFFLQWGATLPRVFSLLKEHLSTRQLLQPSLFSSNLRKIVPPLFLGLIGIASMQINSAIDSVFARYASLEGPAYLWYAIRLEQLPLSLFGIALSSALLPSLSRAREKGEDQQFRSLLQFAQKRTFSLIFPCVIGIFVLGASSVNLLFGRGDFTSHSAYHTTICLWCYGIGLLPSALIQILAPAFYASKEYRIPTLLFTCFSLLNIGLNTLFVFGFHWQAASIALSTSICVGLNALLLFIYLWKKDKALLDRSVLLSIGKVAFCSLLAGGIVLFIGYLFLHDPTLFIGRGLPYHFPRETLPQLFHFGLQAGLYFLLFFVFCKWVKAKDVLELLSIDSFRRNRPTENPSHRDQKDKHF